MPRVMHCDDRSSCSLEQAIDALAALEFDPSDEEKLQSAAIWLKKLGNNRTFLADLLLDQIAGRSNAATALDSGYGPQAIMLSPRYEGEQGGMFLRANIWPAEEDLCFQTSGARSFVYGVPHDHNFSFLTCGYSGPGYRSDYYEYDYESVSGYPSEQVDLRFVERSTLEPGKVMLYRAHRDIHSQLPPDALSVSLNVMHIDPAQCWFDQYGFDLERGEVTRLLNGNTTEVFMRVAIASGSEEAFDFAEWVGQSHPSDRLRLASFEARAAVAEQTKAEGIWQAAEASGSRMVAAIARRRRKAMTA